MTMFEIAAGVGVTSAAGAAVLAQVNPVDVGTKLGTSTPSVVLGIVSCVCVGAIVYLYRRQEKAEERSRAESKEVQDRLCRLIEAASVQTVRATAHIEANTLAMRETGDGIAAQTGVLHEMERGLRETRETIATRPCLLKDKEFVDAIRHPERVVP